MFKKSMEFNIIKVALLLSFGFPCVKSYLTLNSNPTTWLEAQRHCNKNGGTLVTEVQANQGAVSQLIDESGFHKTEYWQGQYITPWVWLKGCFQFESFDGFKANFNLKFNQMSECVKYCSTTNYFGLHDKTCFCFDALIGNSVQTDGNCTIPCPGNIGERCGGNGSLTVYMNDICYTNVGNWSGTISRTVTGNECLPWKNITSVGADSNLNFPDDSLDGASNFCRDPNGTDALWCYTSHNQTENCDVPKCIPDEKKQGIHKCMATLNNGTVLVFEAKDCTTDAKAACLGVDNNLHVINELRSWQAQRAYSRTAQSNGHKCKSLADSSIFINKEVFELNLYWIGFAREYTTIRTADVAGKLGKCFTVVIREAQNGLKFTEVSDCSSEKPFICEIFPVNGSERFEYFTDGHFSTPHYPLPYDPSMHCVWTIYIPDDQLMTLQISMDIEDSPSCQYDFVKIYLGASTNGSQNATLCGKKEQVFHNIDTNITIEFLSDETVQTAGINVTWTFVPNTTATTTTLSTTVTTPLAPFTDSHQGDMDEIKIELSDGSLAGLIVGIVFLVVLAFIAGSLFGKRRRASPSKGKEEGMENGTVNNEAVKLPTLNNENIESEYAFTNAVSETSATDALSPKSGDLERTTASPDKRVSDDPSEASDTSALYSQVNKPKKQDGVTKPKKSSVTTDKSSKQTKIPEELYNSLGEKDENMYANKTANIYNHFDDSEPNYDTTTSPRDMPKKVAPDLETYDSKK